MTAAGRPPLPGQWNAYGHSCKLPPGGGSPGPAMSHERPEKLIAWLRRALDRAGFAAGAASYRPDPLPEDDYPQASRQDFSREMFLELLRELPLHRSRIAAAWLAGDLQQLHDCVHQLLGAAVYCDVPELEDALRALRRALKTRDPATIAGYHARALAIIDTTLQCSGWRGQV